jgi:hypothetical protein
MKRNRDTEEAFVNILSGTGINYLLTLLLFEVSPGFAFRATAIFFVCSFVRCLIVRKIYRKLGT